MSLPVLTTQQIFQNSVNNAVTFLSNLLNANNQQSFATAYNRCVNVVINNPNGSAAQVVTQLGTGAAAYLGTLSTLGTTLTTLGVSGLATLPAYTPNNDGTVTLA